MGLLFRWWCQLCSSLSDALCNQHDGVIKWKHFPRYWLVVRGIHRSPVNSPHKGQWRGALMFSLISAWIDGWVNNREADDLRRHRAHCDVIIVMKWIQAGPKCSLVLGIGLNPGLDLFFVRDLGGIGVCLLFHMTHMWIKLWWLKIQVFKVSDFKAIPITPTALSPCLMKVISIN